MAQFHQINRQIVDDGVIGIDDKLVFQCKGKSSAFFHGLIEVAWCDRISNVEDVQPRFL